MDILVVNPLQAALVTGAAATPGHALAKRYGEKMAKYGEGCRLTGMAFFPLPVEIWWAGMKRLTQVKRLGSALARHSGQEESEAIRQVAQRLAVPLTKGNADLLLNRVPAILVIKSSCCPNNCHLYHIYECTC